MMKSYKRLLLLFVLITCLFIFTLIFSGKSVLDLIIGDSCGNEIIQSLPSPDDERIAYVFKRDCGATTDYSYQLTVLKADKQFQNESGNAFISDRSFSVSWTGDRKLEVEYAPHAENYKMDRRVKEVQIEYLTIVE